MDWRLLEDHIYKRCEELITLQHQDGTWRFCFENSIITDAYMLIMLRNIEYKDEKLIEQLTNRILSQQSVDGLWRNYPDEEPANLSSTIQAFIALLYSQRIKAHDTRLQAARQFIIKQGGLKESDILTKVFLAMNGLYEWPTLPFDPALLFSLPSTAPINLYDISSYARAHFASVFLMFSDKQTLTSKYTPDIGYLDIYNDDSDGIKIEDFLDFFAILSPVYSHLNKNQKSTQHYILNHIEPDGTLLSYSLTTIFMIYGLLASGYKKDSPVIKNAINALLQMFCIVNGTIHLPNSPSTTWDTSLILYTLLEAGVPVSHTGIQKGAQFLLAQQQTKRGDWSVHNPQITPGGWGFSISNTIHPDNDDTQAALRTMAHLYQTHSAYKNSYQRGVDWLLSMQNDDGGWAAFEKNTNRYIIGNLPIKNASDALIDPSTSDLTGRTLEFLGKYHGLNNGDPSIKKAMNWLWENQEKDGSWYGRWGVCYLYGTWAAVTGLIACGANPHTKSVQKAKLWLLKAQNEDGGWGESCKSDQKRKFVKRNESTPSQTAWALDALISIAPEPTPTMEKAVKWLIDHNKQTDYPTGAGLPGSFYVRYHSYNYIWPLMALTHYYKKYSI